MSELQRIIKYFAIAFAASLILGIISSIYYAGSFLNQFTFSDDDEISTKTETSEVSPSTKTLDIDLGASQLYIKEGETFSVETNNKYVTIKQNGSRLAIKEKSHMFSKASRHNKVTIYIPVGMEFSDVSITTGAGVVDVSALTARDLDLELGAGEIVLNNLTVHHETSIESGAGEVTINKGNLHDLSLEAGVGECTLNTILTGEADITAGIGEVTVNLLDSRDNYTVYVEKGIGEITINGKKCHNETTYGIGPTKLEVEGGIGSISINFKEN